MRGRPWWLAAGLALLLLSAAALFAAAVPQAPDPNHHGQALLGCEDCHGAAGLPALEQERSQCRSCHSEGIPAARKGPPATGGQAGARAARTFVQEGKQPGMVVPMYYEESRFGPEPGEMVHIPAGEFIMGSDNRLSDEGPAHRVYLDDYYIDKYEVTNLQYLAFIEDTGRRAPRHFRNRRYPPGKVDHPVTFVSWFDARDYCRWAGKRLPTEQEWEKAARGSDGRVFPWGDRFGIDRANTPVRWEVLGQRGDTTPVGAFPAGASPYGVHDMSGNVWEWTSSWYLPHPGNTRKSENFGHIYKVLKGGSWWDCSFYRCGISAPTFNRSFFNPRVKNASFGFRCARDATPRVQEEG